MYTYILYVSSIYIYVCISYMTESASFSFWRRVVKDSCIQSMRLVLKETYIHIYIFICSLRIRSTYTMFTDNVWRRITFTHIIQETIHKNTTLYTIFWAYLPYFLLFIVWQRESGRFPPQVPILVRRHRPCGVSALSSFIFLPASFLTHLWVTKQNKNNNYNKKKIVKKILYRIIVYNPIIYWMYVCARPVSHSPRRGV